MRRLLPAALGAVAIAAPIPVSLAEPGPEIAGPLAAQLTETRETKAELRKEARTKMRAAERRAAQKKRRAAERKRRAAERRQEARAESAAAAVPVPAHLQAIAQCESGGNPQAVSSNGMYYGKYQFSVATWQAVGGSGLPSAASEAEQDMRAAMLYAQAGPGQWPVCSR